MTSPADRPEVARAVALHNAPGDVVEPRALTACDRGPGSVSRFRDAPRLSEREVAGIRARRRSRSGGAADVR